MKKILIIASAVLMAIGCSPRNITSAYNTPEPIYMNDEADGSITVRAFGEGRNLYDAKTQARKNALRAVIFKGISVPGNAYLSRPLVTELNAQEKYEAFFNEFFKDHGPYEKFVSAWDSRAASDGNSVSSRQARKAATIRILRSELKAYLIENGIIKTE